MMGTIFGGLVVMIFVMMMSSVISFWWGWAAAILWGWFMVPIFGAPSLTTLQCWAIALTLSLFRPRFTMQKSDPDELWNAIGGVALTPPISLVLGWAIKNWFMP